MRWSREHDDESSGCRRDVGISFLLRHIMYGINSMNKILSMDVVPLIYLFWIQKHFLRKNQFLPWRWHFPTTLRESSSACSLPTSRLFLSSRTAIASTTATWAPHSCPGLFSCSPSFSLVLKQGGHWWRVESIGNLTSVGRPCDVWMMGHGFLCAHYLGGKIIQHEQRMRHLFKNICGTLAHCGPPQRSVQRMWQRAL